VFFELTDLLTCPRCGPNHGLVLLVKDVEDRRVMSGWLGCPNCRHDYPVEAGVADLRLGSQASPVVQPHDDAELALKIVALSGMAEERGYLMVGDRLAHVATGIVELAHQLEVVTVREAPDNSTEQTGISRVLSDIRFPLVEYRLRAVAIAPGGDEELVTAAARRVAAGGRLLLFDANESDLDQAGRSGLEIIADQDGTAVAERKPGSLPIIG
jgi:uncharacterized protein YbaR (Trm112 family)